MRRLVALASIVVAALAVPAFIPAASADPGTVTVTINLAHPLDEPFCC